MEEEVRDELKKCDSFLEMVKVANQYFEMDKKLSNIAKGMIVQYLPKLMAMTRIKKRKMWQDADVQ